MTGNSLIKNTFSIILYAWFFKADFFFVMFPLGADGKGSKVYFQMYILDMQMSTP